MTKTRRQRRTRPSRSTILDVPPPRCECLHAYEPDGRCTSEATSRVSVVCAAAGCDCAAGVQLACEHCLSLWRRNAIRDGVELRVRPLR